MLNRVPTRAVYLLLLASSWLVLAGASAGCSGDRLCTQVGCESGVSFALPSLPPGATAEYCVNGECQSTGVAGVPVDFDSDDRITSASVRVTGADGQPILGGTFAGNVKPTRNQPNGPSCGPTCYHARFRLTDAGVLEHVPRSTK